MKVILYTTDYSRQSVTALRFAHLLAKKFDAKLLVLHVFDVPISLASPGSISYLKKEKKLFVKHRAKLEEFCAEHLGDDLKVLLPQIMVEEDASIVSGILQKARQTNADFIAVGTKGASGLKEFFLGSTTKALIKNASCPVLSVPEIYPLEAFNTLAYATDFEQADIFAIQKLIPIASTFKAQINIVHITTKKEYAGDQQMEWFKEMVLQKADYKYLHFELIFADNILEELQWYLEESNIDLLAMLERKDNSFFERYFKPDLVRKMVKDIDIPLLSFNNNA